MSGFPLTPFSLSCLLTPCRGSLYLMSPFTPGDDIWHKAISCANLVSALESKFVALLRSVGINSKVDHFLYLFRVPPPLPLPQSRMLAPCRLAYAGEMLQV